MWNDINDWRIEDNHQGVSLSEIASTPDRIYCLIARNKAHPIIKENFLRIIGAAEMTYGIQYHHDRFMYTINVLAELSIDAPESRPLDRAINHEAVAYVNRIGQFWYFADSEFVRSCISDVDALLPKVREISIYRNKHSAHRSIDSPRNEDTEYLQQQHAAVFTGFSGRLSFPKGTLTKLSKDEMLENHVRTQRYLLKNYLLYQIQLEGGEKVLNFSVEKDHLEIMSEIWDLMEALYTPVKTT